MKIYTLTLAPCYDMHASAEKIISGKENSVTLTSREAGGKGINISRALLSAGIESEAIIALGSDNSEELEKELAKIGLKTRYYRQKGRIRENLTVHTADGGETRISQTGFPVYQKTLDKILSDIEIAEGDIFTFTGSAPSSLGKEDLINFILKIKAMGAKVVIDSKSLELSDIIRISPWLIKPNEEEIAAYLSREIKDPDDALAEAEKLYGYGIENVMISLGEIGAVLVNGDGCFFAESAKITPISTIGAGDSTIAGFIAAKKRGFSDSDALRLAVATGSAACLTEGTKPPKADDIEALYKTITVRQKP